MADDDPTSNTNKRGIPQDSKLLEVQNGSNKSREDLAQFQNSSAAGSKVAGPSSPTLEETVSSNTGISILDFLFPVQATGRTRNGISVSTPQSSNGNKNSQNYGGVTRLQNTPLSIIAETYGDEDINVNYFTTGAPAIMQHGININVYYQVQPSRRSKPVQSTKVSSKQTQTIQAQAPEQQALSSLPPSSSSPTVTPTSSVAVPATPIIATTTAATTASNSKSASKTFTKFTPTTMQTTMTKPKTA